MATYSPEFKKESITASLAISETLSQQLSCHSSRERVMGPSIYASQQKKQKAHISRHRAALPRTSAASKQAS
jgi:hypothetical protein